MAISRRQGGFNNQQGREEAAEGIGVGADGSTMYDDAMMVGGPAQKMTFFQVCPNLLY